MLDADGDGWLDVAVVNEGDRLELFMNVGGTVFVEDSTSRGFSFAGALRSNSLAAADVTGDGVFDLLVGNQASRNLLFVGVSTGAFQEDGLARGIGGPVTATRGVSPIDIGHDGDVDVASGSLSGHSVWVNGPGGVFQESASALRLASTGAGTGAVVTCDVDGDGDLDIWMGRSGLVYINHDAHPSVQNWIKVRPLTTAGAQSAFGATVRLTCVDGCTERGGWSGVRVIDGGSGALSQNGYDAHFGVPVPSAVYNVTVDWPGRVRQSSSWRTHPRLGSIIPSSLPSPSSRVFVVRPAPLNVSVGFVPPWDYGRLFRDPRVGDVVDVPIEVSPWRVSSSAPDLAVLSAEVNGVDVASSWAWDGVGGHFTVRYSPSVDDVLWPWTGLSVAVSVVDSGGLRSSPSRRVVVPGTTFTEASAALGMSSFGNDIDRGVCVGDVNGDGAVDVFVARYTGFNQLWLNNGQGTSFTESAVEWGVAGSLADRSYGCGFADVDGDGDVDLFASEWAGFPAKLYINNGTGFTEEAAARGFAGGGYRTGTAWGDYDGDGDVDLYACHWQSRDGYYVNDGYGVFTNAGSSRGVPSGLRCQQAVALDVDQDGWLDLAVVNQDHRHTLLMNTGGGFFVEDGVARGFAGSASLDAFSVAAGDVTGDGVLDLYVTTGAGLPDKLYVGDGGGIGVFFEDGAAHGVVGGDGGPSLGVTCHDIGHDGDVDVLVGQQERRFGHLYTNDVRGTLRESTADFHLSLYASAFPSAVAADMDGDGDLDVLLSSHPGGVLVSHDAHPSVSNWLKVRPLTTAGCQGAFGATVRLTCVSGCEERGGWSAVLVIDGGSGFYSQNGYDAHFGVPVPSATYAITVLFPGGSLHDQSTQPQLGGVVPASLPPSSRTFTVPNLLYLTSISASPSVSAAPFVNLSSSIVVTLTAGGPHWGKADLLPSADCCLVNGVQVGPSFSNSGDGVYTLAYSPSIGDPEWDTGQLTVFAPLRLPPSTGNNASSFPIVYTVTDSPAGDTVPPVVVYSCRPGPFSPLSWEPICLSCPSEDLPGHGCTFTYSVTVDGTPPGPVLPVPASNITSPTSAYLFLGPVGHSSTVQLDVWSVDTAGNTAFDSLTWTVDLFAPVTTLKSFPDLLSTTNDATFVLECSEDVCSYAYSLDGVPVTVIGGNATADRTDAVATLVDTLVRVPPRRASNVSRPLVSFTVNVSSAEGLLNTTVGVSVGGHVLEVPVVDGTNETDTVEVPALADGTYDLLASATAGDGTLDATPVVYSFTVDTVPPVTAIRYAPPDGHAAASPLAVFGADEPDVVYVWRSGPSEWLESAPWETSDTGIVKVDNVTGGVQHSVEVLAVDRAGNVGSLASASWLPTSCPSSVPDVTITDDAEARVGARFVTFDTTDGSSWPLFEYSFDGETWEATPDKHVVLPSVPMDARHVMQVRAAVPPACNAPLRASRPPPHLLSWTEPPPLPLQVTVVDHPAPSTPDVFAEFTLQPSRPFGTYLQYRLDDASAWTPCGKTLRLGPLQPNMEHRVEVQAVDEDGMNGGDVVSYTWTITSESASSIVLTGLPDGVHAVEVTAFDVVGSAEVSPKTFTWRVDTTRPVTSAIRMSPEFSRDRTAVVDVGCGDGEVPPCTYCWTSRTVDDGCSTNTTLQLTAPFDGYHAVLVTARDLADWDDLSPEPIQWTVDATPPVINVTDVHGVLLPGPPHLPFVDVVLGSRSLLLNVSADEAAAGYGVTNQSSLTVGVRGSDGGSGVGHVKVWAVREEDGVVVSTVVVPMAGASVHGIAVLPTLTSGVYNVSAASVDVAGNRDLTPAWRVVRVDLIPPTSSFVSQPPPVTSNHTVVVAVASSEPAGATYGRVVGSGRGWTAASPDGRLTLHSVPHGSHTLEVYSVDQAGNAEGPPFPSSGPFVVDVLPPVLTWASEPQPHTRSPFITGCFSVADDTAVTVTTTPAVPIASDNCFSHTLSADGVGEVSVWATDAGGNTVRSPLISRWVLDRQPPAVTVTASIAAASEPGSCTAVDTAGTGVLVTVCNAPVGSARVRVACDVDASSPSAISPCRVQHVVTTLALAAGGVCADVPALGGGRRLAPDAGAGDGPGFTDSPPSPIALDVLTDGLYAVTMRAVDAAGNVQSDNTTLEWYVDTVYPVSAPELLQTPDKATSSTSAVFLLRLTGDSSPGQSSFLYRLDGGEVQALDAVPVPNSATVQLRLEALSISPHDIEVWVADQAGNEGPSTLYDWTVVDSAPEVEFLSVPAAVSGDSEPVFEIRAVWPPTSTGNTGVEPQAAIQVNLQRAGFQTACQDTVDTGGVCRWTASALARGGPDTYTLNVQAVLGGVQGQPRLHTWQFLLCEDHQYAEVGEDDFSVACFPCPEGGNCDGGLAQQEDIVAVEGWWAPPGSSGLKFYECPLDGACLPGGSTMDPSTNTTLVALGRCAAGYTGTLCGVCDDGYFEQFGECVECSTSTGVAWAITFLVILLVVIVVVLFFKFKDVLPIDTLKVTLSMMQITASANTAYSIPWPPVFASFLDALRVSLINFVSLTRANCAQPTSFYTTLWVSLVLFKLVLMGIVLGPWVWHKVKHRGSRARAQPGASSSSSSSSSSASLRRRRSSLTAAMATAAHVIKAINWAKVMKGAFLFLFVAYPGLSLMIMRTFKCVEVEGEWWLVADMRLRCFTGQWWPYALYAAVMGALYTVGLPVSILVILWRLRNRLDQEDTEQKYGFLYATYGKQAYLWEVVELVRKLLLSALVVLMAEGSPLQVTFAVFVSAVAHVLHSVFKPWRDGAAGGKEGGRAYVLQHFGLFVTFLVFLMGLLFKMDGVGEGTTYDVLAWTMVVLCGAFLVGAGCLLVSGTARRVRAARVKAAVVGTARPSSSSSSRRVDRRQTVELTESWRGSGTSSTVTAAATGLLSSSSAASSSSLSAGRLSASPRHVRASAMMLMGASDAPALTIENPMRSSRRLATSRPDTRQ